MTSPLAGLAQQLDELRRQLAQAGHRALVWCDSPSDEAVQALLHACRGRSLWIGASEEVTLPAGLETVIPGQARRHLGEETDSLVFDARADIELDALGALMGTLRPGGLLVLMTSAASFKSRFGKRMQGILEHSESVVQCHQGELKVPSAAVASGGVSWPLAVDRNGCLGPDQPHAVAAVAQLKRRRPLVITADRGRGKSAALGIGAAQRLREQGGDILVTAPSLASIESLFATLQQSAPDGQREGTCFNHPNGVVRYLDPLSLAQALEGTNPPGGDGSVLLVDEAAALPTRLLMRCVERFPRIAFATTTHGYEGSGRGFAIRFRAYLDKRTPDWHSLELQAPVRWAPNDPLEQLGTRLLCLDAEIDAQLSMGEKIIVERIDRDRLGASEGALKELFGLLVMAHYRTAPSDLARLLDQRLITLWIARSGNALLGVCATVDEGGYASNLAEEIVRGERRLPGELLPQSLALHEGIELAARLRWRRIMRIAVHPQVQRHGIGRKLIDSVAFDAASKGVALLGASFGSAPGLIDFWSEVGCHPLRLGLRPERSSGENALMVGRALNAEGATLMRECRSHFQIVLADRLALELKGLEADIASRLVVPEMVEEDSALKTALSRLGDGHAPLAPYRPLLKKHWGLLRERLDSEAREGMVALLYQGQDERWLARRFGSVGRAAGEVLWRGWCQRMAHPYKHDDAESEAP